ncbi:hypothetical protein [Aurantiacibacter gangjinensis]|uniref:hypothetical protein n=1 Tax=Aurantiacibacter gangjinensis TaxID=502682 RepID=UPI00090B9B60|nr:hypothetical protein [Aurantiacibacter gangjinensis]APE28025.1 hypothetical protein BMF35_a1196 [Aurantiacibacter gangjinensis]
MSRQLATSAVFSVFAMAAFALWATPGAHPASGTMQTGATNQAAAPALDHPQAILSH